MYTRSRDQDNQSIRFMDFFWKQDCHLVQKSHRGFIPAACDVMISPDSCFKPEQKSEVIRLPAKLSTRKIQGVSSAGEIHAMPVCSKTFRFDVPSRHKKRPKNPFKSNSALWKGRWLGNRSHLKGDRKEGARQQTSCWGSPVSLRIRLAKKKVTSLDVPVPN